MMPHRNPRILKTAFYATAAIGLAVSTAFAAWAFYAGGWPLGIAFVLMCGFFVYSLGVDLDK